MVEQLLQQVSSLEEKVVDLTTQKDSLESKNSSLQSHNNSLQSQIEELNNQIDWLKKNLFGKKSERYIEPSKQFLYLPGLEPVEEEKVKRTSVSSHERIQKEKTEVVIPDNLPIEKEVIDVPEEKKICNETGKPLVKIGEEITRKLAYRPGSYFVKEIIRPKYGLPDGSGVITGDLPPTLLNRCLADDSLLADILVKKYADHLPLYRQEEILKREGISISRQLLSKWVIRAGLALKPLFEELKKEVLQNENIFIDETPIDMQNPGKLHQAYMWVVVGGNDQDPPYRFYDFRLTRKHEHVKDILGNYQGIVHSDKYSAYEKLAKESKSITWIPCMAHVRRKFFEIQEDSFAKEVLTDIQELYSHEKIAWDKSPEERLQIRKEKEEPLLIRLLSKMHTRLEDKILPVSPLRKAIGYTLGMSNYLKNYLHNPYSHIDNNVAERAIRPLAIGRKNWLFVGDPKGAEAAAIMFSLIQSCRGAKVNPRDYLTDVMRKLNDYNSQNLKDLLPLEWANSQKKIKSRWA